MRRERQRLADEQWRRVFQQQRRSGLSIVAFCEREGLASSTFFAKRRELEPASSCDPAAFVEVTGVDRDDEAGHVIDNPAAAGDGEPIELVLRGSVMIRVRDGFDASLLRRVVEVLA